MFIMFIMNINYLIEWFKRERIDLNNSIDNINVNIKEIKIKLIKSKEDVTI